RTVEEPIQQLEKLLFFLESAHQIPQLFPCKMQIEPQKVRDPLQMNLGRLLDLQQTFGVQNGHGSQNRIVLSALLFDSAQQLAPCIPQHPTLKIAVDVVP